MCVYKYKYKRQAHTTHTLICAHTHAPEKKVQIIPAN